MDKKFIDTGRSRFGFSRFQCFAQCPRKYAYDYISKEKTPRPFSKSLEKGSMVHIGLAHYYTQGDEHMSPIQAIEHYSNNLVGDNDVIEECTNKAKESVLKYIENYEDDEFEIISIEEEYEYNVSPTRSLTQRVDLIYKDLKTDEIVFCDHKTTSRYSKSIVDNYRMSGQFIGYTLIASQHFGIGNPKILLNVIVMTKEVKFYRHSLQLSNNAISNYPRMICHIYDQMDNYGDNVEDYPMIMTEFSCNGKYGRCPHYKRCTKQ